MSKNWNRQFLEGFDQKVIGARIHSWQSKSVVEIYFLLNLLSLKFLTCPVVLVKESIFRWWFNIVKRFFLFSLYARLSISSHVGGTKMQAMTKRSLDSLLSVCQHTSSAQWRNVTMKGDDDKQARGKSPFVGFVDDQMHWEKESKREEDFCSVYLFLCKYGGLWLRLTAISGSAAMSSAQWLLSRTHNTG